MMNRLIECVPNFSEGRDMNLIKQITDEIESVEKVKLLDVDPGKATNRTVVTFVGPPDEVVEAAFRAVKMAARLINMKIHKGEHPRFGATDVCPLVPVAGISMEETVEYARKLAQRIGDELQYPVYCYESAAFSAQRKNLAAVRSGEYEGLQEKLSDPDWKPDFGPAKFSPATGATAVGARDFLVAYNINLNTTSARRANAIAFDVRERGRAKRKGDPLTGEIIRDEQGNPVMIPGSLKEVKAIGWYIEEYGIAQISMNLTNISVTPVHVAFDEVFERAEARGVRVSGSELVGLIPLKAILEAGRHFLRKQKRSVGVSDKELIKIAVKSMGLDDLYPFKPEEKIIEYMIADSGAASLAGMSVREFMEETASESPAPGGGSISACMGSLGTALGTMVANLSSHKRGWDDRWEEFSDWAERGKAIQEELLALVDEDTLAFNMIMEAFAMPKNTADELRQRKAAIEEATRKAILVPYRIMKTAAAALEILKAMAETGNPDSVSDAGVGALAIRSAVMGAFLNVKINAGNLEDKSFTEKILKEGRELEVSVCRKEAEILKIVEARL
ncbi:MAG: formiminotransferase-cyclodeaminase [Bacteroides sp. SM23_62]|nr:MAG: formiminotransferase-cyclodeaminase [Bacteroides sp. SM23_62]